MKDCHKYLSCNKLSISQKENYTSSIYVKVQI